jgi:hypothetical protein
MRLKPGLSQFVLRIKPKFKHIHFDSSTCVWNLTKPCQI